MHSAKWWGLVTLTCKRVRTHTHRNVCVSVRQECVGLRLITCQFNPQMPLFTSLLVWESHEHVHFVTLVRTIYLIHPPRHMFISLSTMKVMSFNEFINVSPLEETKGHVWLPSGRHITLSLGSIFWSEVRSRWNGKWPIGRLHLKENKGLMLGIGYSLITKLKPFWEVDFHHLILVLKL